MTDDHHGRMAGRATLLARAMDEILGSGNTAMALSRRILFEWRYRAYRGDLQLAEW
jgi:hypothetical protein